MLSTGKTKKKTRTREPMKEKLLSPLQKLYLSKRNLIETVIGQLKATYSLEHLRHRSSKKIFLGLYQLSRGARMERCTKEEAD